MPRWRPGLPWRFGLFVAAAAGLGTSPGASAVAAVILVPGDVATIEGAFQVAQPGDEILVAPGQYDVDPIAVTTANLTLRSEPPRSAILLATQFVPMFDVQADDFALEDVSLLPQDAVARTRPTAHRTRIEGCLWEPPFYGYNGLQDEGPETVVRGNEIHAFSPAVSSYSPSILIEENVFRECGFSTVILRSGGTVRGNEFRDNANISDTGTPGQGGALRLMGAHSVVIEDNLFTGNLTDGWDGESGQGQGGAISLELASATIEGNVFRRNQSLQGGAIFAQYSNATIRGNLFYANTDSVQYAENGLRGRGGALYFYESTGLVEGNTLVGNTALVDGAAIYMTVSAIEFRNNLVAGNRSDGGGVTTADIAPLAWECNDVWSSGASEYAGWPDPTGTDGNVSADPLFCDASSGDFSIDASSPCAPAQSDGCGLIGAYGIGCGVTSVPEGGGLTGAVAAYPNPAVDHLWLRLASGAAGDIDVFDASGRRVRSLHWSGDGDGTSSSGTGSAGSLFWDLRGDGGALLPAGVYWARPRKAAGSAERFVIAPR